MWLRRRVLCAIVGGSEAIGSSSNLESQLLMR